MFTCRHDWSMCLHTHYHYVFGYKNGNTIVIFVVFVCGISQSNISVSDSEPNATFISHPKMGLIEHI